MRTASISREHKNPCIRFLSDQEFNDTSIAKRASILVIEDDELLQKVTPLILKLCGYSVTLATTGKDAIKLFSNKYDLILLDIRLPDMSGFELCRKMRDIERGTHTPILAYTAFGDLVKRECIESGMDGLLTKGCVPISEMKTVINEMINIKNMRTI